MKPGDADEWWANMLKIQEETLVAATQEVNRLRRRVRELEAIIAAGPADLTALQDRVTQLEQLLADAVASQKERQGG